MKIISKMLVGALAFAVTNVYAAELLNKKIRDTMRRLHINLLALVAMIISLS